MKTLAWLNTGVLVLCTACSPLQQAPLVYSSKIAVGIDITGTSTESPGASLTIGYKQVDAAYVPVAVAKPCDDKAVGVDCTKPTYDLKVIVGTSTTEGSKHSGPSEEQAKKAVQDYEAALKNLNGAKNSRDFVVSRIASLSGRKSALEASAEEFKKQQTPIADLLKEKNQLDAKKISRTATAQEEKRLEEVGLQITRASELKLTPAEAKELAESAERIAAAQNELKSISAEMIALETAVERLRPQYKAAKQELDKLVRNDAFSVYGRFESATGVDNSKASVGLGKVFSTGVASQHLSQGLGDYYKSLGMAACYDAIAKLSVKISDPAVLQKLLADCRSSSISNASSP